MKCADSTQKKKKYFYKRICDSTLKGTGIDLFLWMNYFYIHKEKAE